MTYKRTAMGASEKKTIPEDEAIFRERIERNGWWGFPLFDAVLAYHRYRVVGLEHVPKQGSAFIVANHSLATYDIVCLIYYIFRERGRNIRPLIDRAFYKVPLVAKLLEFLGSVQGSPDSAKALLNDGWMLCVAPGGMREALRPSSERYQFLWERRKGFVRLAIETGTPIILAACPKADDLYTVYKNPLSKLVYDKFRLPLFFARGVGLTPIPKPVALTHFLSEPIQPPPLAKSQKAREQQLERFHQKIVKRMEHLMGEAIAYRRK